MGVGWIQRAAASKARWPMWVFMQSDDCVAFINQSAMGDLREDILVDGPEYVIIDGWKREITCKATWGKDSLVVTKRDPEGAFRETRTVINDSMTFTIEKINAPGGFPQWGRKFQRLQQ